MGHITKELALQLYKDAYWNPEKEWQLSGSKRDNYQSVTVDAQYDMKGVIVTQYWEHKGHHEKVYDRKLFKAGKVYQLEDYGPDGRKVIGKYIELE